MNSSGCSKNILLSKGSKKEYFGMDLIPSTDLHSNLMNPEEEPSKILEEDGLRNISPICPMEFEDFTSELNFQPGLPGQDFDCAFTSMDLGNNSEAQGQEDTIMLQYEEIGSLEMANSSPCPTSPTVSDSVVQRTAEKNLEVVHMTNGEDDPIVHKSKTFEEFPHDSVSVVEELSQVPADKEEGNESLPSLDGNHSENHHEETLSCGPSGNDHGNHEDWDDSKASERSPTREQPKRLARPKNLRDSTKIVGTSPSKAISSQTKRKSTEKKASSSPRAKSCDSVGKGRNGRKPQPKAQPHPQPQPAEPIIAFKGTAMSLRDFERLPSSERLEIEEVDNPFFDRKQLCFRVKRKYYPDNHKEKYNDEWADEMSGFPGGVQAVDTFLKKFKVNAADKNFYKKVKKEWELIKRKQQKKNEDEELLSGSSNEYPQEESSTQGDKSPQKTVTEPKKSKAKIKALDELKDSHSQKHRSKKASECETNETYSSAQQSLEIKLQTKSAKKMKFSSKQPSVHLENPTENSKVATSSHSTTTYENETAGDDEFHRDLDENSSTVSSLMTVSSRTENVENVLGENKGVQDKADGKIENPVEPINTDEKFYIINKHLLDICNKRPLQIKIPRVDPPKKTNSAPLPVVQTAPEVNRVGPEPPANSTTSEISQISTSTPRGRNYEKHKRYEQRKIETLSPEEYRVYKAKKRKKMRTRHKVKRQQRQELIKTVRAQLIERLQPKFP